MSERVETPNKVSIERLSGREKDGAVSRLDPKGLCVPC